MRFNKNEDIAMYLMENHPELCEDDVLRPTDTVCVRIPVKAPEGSISSLEIPALAISSTDVRRRVDNGYPVWYLVPDGVVQYIAKHELYGPHE
jgi:nicotinic acid mononucleotide adenylyltransferase